MKYFLFFCLALILACEKSEKEIPLTITIMSPQENAEISNDVPVNISIATSIVPYKIVVYFDDRVIGTVLSTPLELTWTPRGRAEGDHIIKAVATKGDEVAVATIHVFIGYSVGSSNQGGTIYYLDETGRHGLVVANQDLTFTNQKEHFWGPESFMAATDSADGKTNTATLSNTSGMEAYFWSLFKMGLTYNGYSDWYVPSKKEFLILAGSMGELETTSPAMLQDTYWTSTECCRSQACAIDFKQNKAITVLKADSSFRVRPIRKF